MASISPHADQAEGLSESELEFGLRFTVVSGLGPK